MITQGLSSTDSNFDSVGVNGVAVSAWDALELIYRAVEVTKGETNGDALIAAMKGQSWNSPRGPISIDPATRDIIQNIYMRKVEKVGGKLQNTVVHTYPSVSQFWTYKQEEFLKNPVYDRNYPPCKFCD